jgi:hypothetical protein
MGATEPTTEPLKQVSDEASSLLAKAELSEKAMR